MVLSLPKRIPLGYAAAFGAVLCAIQILQGTSQLFSLLCFVFICAAALAFNVSGGLTYPSGAYVFFFATLTLIVGLMTKGYLGEAADSHLRQPELTMEVYAASMVCMLLVAYYNSRLRRRTGLLDDLLGGKDLGAAATGCVLAGIAFPAIGYYASSFGDGPIATVLTAMRQLNNFLAMAILLGVTHEIRVSEGRRSLNFPVIIATLAMLWSGVFLEYSKQALFTPPICWLVAAGVMRYRIKPLRLLAGVALTGLAAYYLVPYCQAGRNFREENTTYAKNVNNSLTLLSDLGELRRQYDRYSAEWQDPQDVSGGAYFSTSQGLLDRLEMISMDDGAIDVTQQREPLGIFPLVVYVENIVPHFLWKNKPSYLGGNMMAHELGILADDDLTTGISFSPLGEAYRDEEWIGILVLLPILWFLLFLVTDSMCGEAGRSPWALLAIVEFAHAAPEGALGGTIYALTYGTFGIFMAAMFSSYIMPLLASLVSLQRPKMSALAGATPRTR